MVKSKRVSGSFFLDGQVQTGEWKEVFFYMVKSKRVSGRKGFSTWSSPNG